MSSQNINHMGNQGKFVIGLRIFGTCRIQVISDEESLVYCMYE